MPDNPNIHWTEDDDLLAQFVLGRSSAEETKRLQDHLSSCPECAEAVRKERSLVSAMRQQGREDLKARLRKQLTASPDSHHNDILWKRVLSVAAVVMIISGIGIYNRWFNWGGQTVPAGKQQFQESAKISEENKTKLEPPKEKNSETGQLAARQESNRGHETFQMSLDQRNQNVQNNAIAAKAQTGLAQGIKADQNAGASSAGGEGFLMKKDLDKEQDQIGSEGQGEKQYWVEGIVLRIRSGFEDGRDAANRVAAPKIKLNEQSYQRQRPSVGELKEGGITVSQQKIDLLPAERQRLQQQPAQTIQTYVQQSDRGTNLTLYLDTLYDESDLRNAGIEEIRPDSIVLEIESKRIGFKLQSDIPDLQKPIQKARQK